MPLYVGSQDCAPLRKVWGGPKQKSVELNEYKSKGYLCTCRPGGEGHGGPLHSSPGAQHSAVLPAAGDPPSPADPAAPPPSPCCLSPQVCLPSSHGVLISRLRKPPMHALRGWSWGPHTLELLTVPHAPSRQHPAEVTAQCISVLGHAVETCQAEQKRAASQDHGFSTLEQRGC